MRRLCPPGYYSLATGLQKINTGVCEVNKINFNRTSFFLYCRAVFFCIEKTKNIFKGNNDSRRIKSFNASIRAF